MAPGTRGRIDFFISYTQADRRWATWIARQLEEAGYTTVIQAWDMVAGSNFVVKMQDVLVEAAQTIAVLSPDYLKSVFGLAEWAAAIAADPVGLQRKLLPVRVVKCSPQGLLGPIVYVDLVGRNSDEARDALLAGVMKAGRHPDIAPPFPG